MHAQRIVVTGASGLVGGRLVPYLEAAGYDVTRLVRRPAERPGESQWDPQHGRIDANVVEGAVAVINLAGVSIAGGRWSEARKRDILTSRVDATRLLARTIVESKAKPAAFVSTSAIGYYGDGGSNVLTEQSPRGSGFLADVCEAWESSASPAQEAGVRVVHPRFGIVLGREGGMLAQLRKLFGFGLGGRIGSGQQFMSWVDLDDLVHLLGFLVIDDSLSGPVNAVAPNPVTNREFTEALGASLGRPTLLPAPAFAVRTAMGQMADELVLVSQRAIPAALDRAGFGFDYPTIDASLRHQLRNEAAISTMRTPHSMPTTQRENAYSLGAQDR